MAEYAQVRQMPRFGLQQQMADARRVHFNTDEVAGGTSGRQRHQVLAIAEADLQRDWRAPAEDLLQVERRAFTRQSITRPKFIQRARLRGGHASGAQYIAADRAMRDGLLVVAHWPSSSAQRANAASISASTLASC